MTLAEALSAAEAFIERPLLADEVAMVAQLVEAGKSGPEIVAVFDQFERVDVSDDDVETYRYEPANEAEVRQI